MEHDEMRKRPEQVAAEYDAADDAEEWFVSEVADFFAPGEDDDEARIERLSTVFDRLEDEREEFLSALVDDDDLLSVDIEFRHPGREAYDGGCFRSMPSPVVLLEMCNCIAEPGDEVVVRHRYANGWIGEMTANWPFGMDDAVDLTAPLAERLSALDDEQPLDGRAGRASANLGELTSFAAAAATALAAASVLVAAATTAAALWRRPR